MRATFAAVVAIVVCAAAPAEADPRADLIDGMVKCRAIADNAARLACYDALNPAVPVAQAPPSAAPPSPAQPARPAPFVAVPPPPSAAPAAKPPADDHAWYDPSRMFGANPQQAQTTPQQFGSDTMPKPAPSETANAAPEEIDSISAGVVDYSFNPIGRFLVVLDNGQIWQQIEGDTAKAHFHPDKNVVTISRGVMGSYSLQLNDARSFKVRRLK